MKPEFKCKFCDSTNIVSVNFTIYLECYSQLFLCLKCGKISVFHGKELVVMENRGEEDVNAKP